MDFGHYWAKLFVVLLEFRLRRQWNELTKMISHRHIPCDRRSVRLPVANPSSIAVLKCFTNLTDVQSKYGSVYICSSYRIPFFEYQFLCVRLLFKRRKRLSYLKDFCRELLQEAQKDPTSFTDLVRRLLRRCETELQRVRSALLLIVSRLFIVHDQSKMEHLSFFHSQLACLR